MIAWHSMGNHCWQLINSDEKRKREEPYCLAKIELIGDRWFGLIYPNETYHIRPCISVQQMMNRCSDAIRGREHLTPKWLRGSTVARKGDERDTPRQPRLYKLNDIFPGRRS